MGMIPKQTQAEQKISIGFLTVSFKRIMGLMITAVIAAVFARLMYKWVGIAFIVIACIIYLKLTSVAPNNPTKTFFKGLIDFVLYIFSRKTLYNSNSYEYIASENRRKEIADAKEKKQIDRKKSAHRK